MKALRLVGLLVLLQSLVGCAVNPATGRSDFVMMSEQQELAMGRQYNQEIAKQYPRYPDEALQAYVQQVGERVARYSHRSNLAYRFTVVDSPDINAFALPGGYIYIHRGLMAYLNSEAELAAVLGHEVGHVTARHSVRQQSQSAAWGILGQAVAIGTGVVPRQISPMCWAARWSAAMGATWSWRPMVSALSTWRAVATIRAR